MKKTILYVFEKWWIPILFYLFAVILFATSVLLLVRNAILNIATGLLMFSLLLLAISTVFQGIRRKWWKAILTFLLLAGTVFVFYSFHLIFSVYLSPGPYGDGTDRWADNLVVPENIPIENPVERRTDSASDRQTTGTDFQLYNSSQPGIYEYDFWTGKIERGTVYLKAFEITREYALSTKRLPQSSSIKVYNPTDSIKKFGTTSSFTIYEGDWGKPYAARFEVWFKPDNGGQERKLLTKNYKIEGWQR
ncbi:MAG: hypothetical protein LBE91_07755 [Tannerella sp.]|jgi:hypothetical protein|nr:hypothetical protein [Tannerella sp.]